MSDKISAAMTSQSKHKTDPDPHAENKALYAEDCKHSNAPWELWECLSCLEGWVGGFTKEPSWIPEIKYRRKPDAPVWPEKQPVDMIDRLTEFMRPTSKYGHIKRGDQVMCWNNNGDKKERRHFSHEKNNGAYCFYAGMSEFTAGKEPACFWFNCELWDGTNG